MKRKMIAAIAAPVFALAAAGIGAFASSNGPAYGDSAEKLDAARAYANAKATFLRADGDGSGALDAHEYSSLAIVTAELAHLNGFVAVEDGVEAQVVLLPIAAPQAISQGERARVDAVSRSRFYAIAGDDARMTIDEYLGDQASRFEAADRNRDGALKKKELVAYVANEVLLTSGV